MTTPQARISPGPLAPGRAAARLRARWPGGANLLPQSAATSAPPSQEPVMAGPAALLIGLYLALHAFFAPEFITRITGASIPVVAAFAALLPVIWLVISPQPLRFLQTGIAKAYIFLLVWWMISVAVMSFRGYIPE